MSILIDRLRRALSPNFTVEREISSGGMGRVYLGKDLTLGRPVAIKVLRPELASAPAAAAQSSAPFSEGVKLRVTLEKPTSGKVVGTVVSSVGDTITVARASGDTLSIPLQMVRRAEASKGLRSNFLRGMRVGGSAGSFLGMVFLLASEKDEWIGVPSDAAYNRALISTVAGVVLGAVIGGSTKSERWEVVPETLYKRTVIKGKNGRLLLGLSLEF